MRLQVRLNALFLVGGALEQRPYLMVHGSWEGARESRRVDLAESVVAAAAGWPAFVADPVKAATTGAAALPWVDLGAMPLPPVPTGAAATDDNMVHVTMHAHTNLSMIEAIDKEEKAYVQRTVEAGAVAVSLTALLQQQQLGTAAQGADEVRLVDAGVYNEMMRRALLNAAGGDATVFQNPAQHLGGEARVKTLNDLAVCLATKASLSVRVAGPAPAAAATYLAAHASLGEAQRFGTAAMMGAWEQAAARLERLYWIRATDLPPPPDEAADKVRALRLPANPNSPLTRDLHMISYEGAGGERILPLGFALQRAEWRPAGASLEKQEAQPLASDAVALRHTYARLLSSVLAHGMRPADFVRVVEAQHAQPAASLAVASSYLTAVAAVADVATYPANQFHYTGDHAFINAACYDSLTPAEKALVAEPAARAPDATATALSPTTVARVGRVSRSAARNASSHPACLAARFAAGGFGHMVAALGRRAPFSSGGIAGRRFGEGDATAVQPPATPPAPTNPYAVSLERWSVVLAGPCSAGDDCEDGGFAAPTILRATRELLARCSSGRRRNDTWRALEPGAAAMLGAASKVLSVMVPHAAGGTVAEPYVETSASAGGGKGAEPPATGPLPILHPQLPVVGSPEALKWVEGGHAFAILENARAVGRRYRLGVERWQGAHPDDRAAFLARIDAAFGERAGVPAWAGRLPSLLLEGTGPVNPYVLPAEETYAGTDRAELFVRKQATKTLFVRALRGRQTPDLETLSRFARVQTQPYEVRSPSPPLSRSLLSRLPQVLARADPRQHVSTFYFHPSHVISATTATAVSPLLGHTIVCGAQSGSRAVDVGAYLRDATARSDAEAAVAYVGPYTPTLSEAEWARDVAPHFARLMAQQPVATWGERDLPAAHQMAQPLASSSVVALAGAPTLVGATLGAVVDRAMAPAGAAFGAPEGVSAATAGLPPPDLKALALIEGADAGDAHAVLQLYVPTWKLTSLGQEKTREMVAALDRLQRDGRIAAYLFMRDRAIVQTTEQVRLLVALPVAATLEEKDFPRA